MPLTSPFCPTGPKGPWKLGNMTQQTMNQSNIIYIKAWLMHFKDVEQWLRWNRSNKEGWSAQTGWAHKLYKHIEQWQRNWTNNVKTLMSLVCSQAAQFWVNCATNYCQQSTESPQPLILQVLQIDTADPGTKKKRRKYSQVLHSRLANHHFLPRPMEIQTELI